MKYCPQCRSDNFACFDLKHYRCADCGYQYFHNPAATVAAIISVGDEILFTVRAQQPAMGCLDLPGGFVDPHEGLEQALRRELREELDLEVSQLRYFASYANTYIYGDVEYFTCDAVFCLNLPEKPRLRIQAEELSGVTWLRLAELDLQQVAFASLRQALQRYKQQ